MAGKSKVLIVGGTGYLGKRLVKASLANGHDTYILQRPEIGVEIEKVEMLISFKMQGAHLVTASFDDHRSLVDAVKLVDVVICAISGVHIRSHHILLQLKLVDAIKEAVNIKRFLPSEFGTDPARMENAMEPGRVTFDDKMVVRKAIEEAGIPFTYVSASCFAGYFLGGLCQIGQILPSRHSVVLLGDGNQKAIYVDEDDIATYTIKAIDDPRTLNKTLYLRPPKNILSQREVVQIWEELIGKELKKSTLSKEEFLAPINELEYAEQIGLCHYYHVCYEGCLVNFEIGEEGEEASKLYPEPLEGLPWWWKRGRVLGRGGFGVASLASTSNAQFDGFTLLSLIAVKSSIFTASQSLKEEAQFLRMFKHSPYIIRSFGANLSFEDGVIHYNLMLKYASGGSLASRLQNCNSLPESQVMKHTKNVLLGFSHVHSSGIIHCDIKPGNILLVGTDGTAKIAVFGLSMTLEQGMNQKQGVIRGTARYIPPESVLNAEYGPPVDIWALGCTVYELITGTPQWESDSRSQQDPDDDDVLDKIEFEEPNFQNFKVVQRSPRLSEKVSCQEYQLPLDCRHALEPSLSTEFIQSRRHCKDKEEAKRLPAHSTQTTAEDIHSRPQIGDSIEVVNETHGILTIDISIIDNFLQYM
ncbi:hypothetical protein HAX54_045374 [Datura stramonium]|uniref:(+)-lariciresinol reductase n=1 Tax=Datura stramonium TaxID=4076 RepID=A0ABS8SQV8_DATST|nr:hypothetical protein [Datura stramonium]